MQKIFVITGEKGVGKSFWIERCAKEFKKHGWDVGGVISSVKMIGGVNNEIWVKDIRSGETKCLAIKLANLDVSSLTPFWQFKPESLEWGNQIILMSVPCDILMIDELGLLELEYDQGWTQAFKALGDRKWKVAVLTIRPQLLHKAQEKFGSFEIIELEELNRAQNKQRIEECLKEIECVIESYRSSGK